MDDGQRDGWTDHLSWLSLNPLCGEENLALNLLQSLLSFGLYFRDYMEKYFRDRQFRSYF